MLYQKFDTHWNRLGAFFGFLDLFNEIKNDFPELPYYDLNDFDIDTTENTKGNLLWMVGTNKGYSDPEYDLKLRADSIIKIGGKVYPKTDDFPYDQYKYCKRYTSSNAHPDSLKVLLFHDSYAVLSYPFLPYFFSETLYIWDSWKYKFNKEIVESERPDVIVYWMYEGYIDRILLAPSFVEPDSLTSGLQ